MLTVKEIAVIMQLLNIKHLIIIIGAS